MYLYQTARRKQERKTKVMIALCLIGITLFFVESGKRKNDFQKEMAEILGHEMVTYCLPFLEYATGNEIEKHVQDYMLQYIFPVLGEGRKEKYYKTDIESAFSYEMILAMEAADENFVDDAGKVVGDADEEELTPEMPSVEDGVDDGMLEQFFFEEAQKLQEDVTNENEKLYFKTGKTKKEVTYSREKLADFDYLIQNFYRIDKTTTINRAQLNVEEMLEKDMTLKQDADSPQILIYHTHSQEGYVDSVPGEQSTTVVGVGAHLAGILQEQYGLQVIHHTGEYDVESRDNAYSLAGPAVEKILAENPGIEVVIDLHRDGVGADTRLVTNIDGMDMAKIMFVNGLSRTTSVGEIGYLYNPNLKDNLAFSFQNQLVAAEYYPGLSRGVYLKGYRYNLHYCPKSLLVEVGAQTNTVQEAMNAMVPLADILHKVVVGEADN